ncbi:MAG: CRISPR-associated protein Cmr5 [Planctomycetaceae bacterium]|nr:CRISPR-associated protein Cmr5 [Planctomycetaceae bacterium]
MRVHEPERGCEVSVNTRSQRLAQKAYACIDGRTLKKEYSTFARKFPALVHACGLAQAVAFAVAKKETDYLADLAAVLTAGGHQNVPNPDALAALTRTVPVSGYLRLTRDTLDAAVWLKRYVEAVNTDEPDNTKVEENPHA